MLKLLKQYKYLVFTCVRVCVCVLQIPWRMFLPRTGKIG